MSMYSSIPRSVSIAFSRLRLAVISCCWIIGLAVFAQIFIWSLSTFTDLRFESVEESAEAPLIIHAQPESRVAGQNDRLRERRSVPLPDAATSPDQESQEAAESGHPKSQTDQRFAGIFDMAAGFGQCAMLILIAVVGLTVMLAAGAGVTSVDRTVSSFLWLLLVALLILPAGNVFSLPWQNGALTSYEHMTESVDLLRDQQQRRIQGTETEEGAAQVSTVEFYVRFCLLPITCIVGVTLVGLRFCASLDGTLPQREPSRLDPNLEREASNITPTSLHGGRSGSVLNRAIANTAASDQEKSMPSARSVSPGEQPKRLI